MSGIVLRTLISTSWYVGETVLPQKEVVLTLVWGKGNGMMCSSFHLVVLTQESPWEPPPPRGPQPTLHYRLCLGMLRSWVTDTPALWMPGCWSVAGLPVAWPEPGGQLRCSLAALLGRWGSFPGSLPVSRGNSESWSTGGRGRLRHVCASFTDNW